MENRDTEGGLVPDKKRIRMAVALVYFSMGLSFSSWASRIPDIKTAFYYHYPDGLDHRLD